MIEFLLTSVGTGLIYALFFCYYPRKIREQIKLEHLELQKFARRGANEVGQKDELLDAYVDALEKCGRPGEDPTSVYLALIKLRYTMRKSGWLPSPRDFDDD